MATIRKEIMIEAPADLVWDAVRDVGAVHSRLVPGFVVDTTLENDVRVVTFASGIVLREIIVTLDDDARRLAYTSVGSRATHHNASIEVLEGGPGESRLVWTTDVLPAELAPFVQGQVDASSAIMKSTMEEVSAIRR